MRNSKIKNWIIYGLLLLVPMVGNAQNDIAGSKDHPLISRYPGSVIEWYGDDNFKEYQIAVGPVTGYRYIEDWVKTEGKITRIYYSLKGERTMTEVYKNYLSAVKKGGFKIMAEGYNQERNVKKEVGGGSWMGVHYAANPTPTNSGIKLLQGSSETGGHCYLAGKLSTETGTVYIVIGGHQYTQTEVVFLVDIIETTTMEDGLVTVDAKAMGDAIDREGKVALYGIQFALNKSDILPESEPVLAQIAQLLWDRPALNVYIVGHTDMTGEPGYNFTLSESRAKAVVDYLTSKHGVAAARLVPKGVGPLSPVATNQTEDGRAKNRRVELVQK